VYRDRAWPLPDGPPLRLTLDQVDSLPEVQPVQQAIAFQHDALRAVIDPRRLLTIQGVPVLERADLIFFQMLVNNWPQRPVYISRTAGDYAERMGLGAQVVAQGLARKVVGPVTPSDSVVLLEGSGWFDLSRSAALWREFEGPQALVDFGKWVDRPSVSTAFSYLLAGSELAEVQRVRGDASYMGIARQVETLAKAVRLDNLLQVAPAPVSRGDTGR
jgi:hypothetical protein